MPRIRKVFLSHANEDAEIADVLANAIKRTTLHQIDVWFSNDKDTSGGIRAGEIWSETLFKRLRTCDVVIAIVTPNSINQPWIHFECGIAAAAQSAKVVPVCVGVDPTKLPLPLGIFQAYLASTPAGLGDLVARLCQACDAKFDDDMAKPILEPAARLLGARKFVPAEDAAAMEPLATRAIQDHVDKRFYELTELLRGSAPSLSAPAVATEYTINLRINFPERQDERVIVISTRMTIQLALDQVYFELGGLVRPYTYLQNWALLSHPDQRPLVTMAGGFDDMPASAFLRPNTTWVACRLEQPFTFGQTPKFVQPK
jgi:hypothetical protein